MTGHAYRPGPPTGSAAAHPPSRIDLPPEIEEVRVLRLQPGDILVARVAEEATPDAIEGIRKRLEAMFPDHKTLVCLGITLEVARQSEQFDGTGS